jgi:hypothetical protein
MLLTTSIQRLIAGCNRLPALCRYKIAAWKVPIQPQRHPIYCLQIDICLQITVPISVTYYPIMSYHLHLLRVYIEALELHSQSSRSFNSSHCKAYSYEPGSHYLLTNQSDRTTCCTINLLPHSRSHYFYHLCKCLELLHLSNERTIDPSRRTYPTDERTDESN